jgi:Ca2+-binding RTX toxin-like protein
MLVFSVLAIIILPHAVLAASGPTATMKAWSPGPGVISVGTPVTFRATGSADTGVQGFEWDFDGDGEPDAYSATDSPGKDASGSIVRTFSEPTTVYPAVRAVDNEGFVSNWDAYDVNGLPVQLVIGKSAPPKVTMNRWSPYSATGPDGTPSTSFIFSASASSVAGLARLEWDFDGDGKVDAMSPVSGASASAVTTRHMYGLPGSWTPKVRAVDVNGLPSLWAAYTAGMQAAANVDVAIPELAATLKFSRVGDSNNNASANGAPSATYSFSLITTGANATGYDWDFDGDGKTDATTSAPAAQHTYGKYGLFLPTVTVRDGFGTRTVVLPLGADAKPAYIGVLGKAPVATMGQWSPFSAEKEPDGSPSTVFTFSAGATAQAGVQKFEWDFDGDGKADAVTPISGAPVSATASTTYAYGKAGNFIPQVRAVDATNQVSQWASYNNNMVKLDVASGLPEQPSTEKPSTEKYCNDMTIDQLIASGRYNVVDKRNSDQRMIFGTRGTDLILGGGSNVILGRAGDDCIIAGAGNNYVFGNEGNDTIYGGTGNDIIDGGLGHDLIYGMAGSDNIKGGAGDDRINGGPGDDTIDGGVGSDWCYGGEDGNDDAVNCEMSGPFD